MVLNGLGAHLNSPNVNMKSIIKFIKEAILELSKVAWPTRNRVIRMTIGVLLISAAFALFIGLVDIGLSKGIASLLSFVESRQATSSTSNSPIQVNPGDIQVDSTPAQ